MASSVRYCLLKIVIPLGVYARVYACIIPRIPEKPDKQMEIFYGTERFTSEFDGLLKPSHVGKYLGFLECITDFP